MAANLIGVAFGAGVAAALKLFQGKVSTQNLAKGGETVMKGMKKAEKAAKAAAKAKK